MKEKPEPLRNIAKCTKEGEVVGVQVINHGIPSQLIDDMFLQSSRCASCPTESHPSFRAAFLEALKGTSRTFTWRAACPREIPGRPLSRFFNCRFFGLSLDVKHKCAHDPSSNIGFESHSQIRPSTGRCTLKGHSNIVMPVQSPTWQSQLHRFVI